MTPSRLIKYFAIASMINKTSINARDVDPITTKPAELLDHKIVFEVSDVWCVGWAFRFSLSPQGCGRFNRSTSKGS